MSCWHLLACRSVLQQPLRITVGARNTAASSVSQRLTFVGRENGKLMALRQLLTEGLKPPVLVFVASKVSETLHSAHNLDTQCVGQENVQVKELKQLFTEGLKLPMLVFVASKVSKASRQSLLIRYVPGKGCGRETRTGIVLRQLFTEGPERLELVFCGMQRSVA